MELKLNVPVNCDCGHSFKIDPVGVGEDTDIVCPKCQKVDHFSLSTIDRLHEEYAEAIADVYEDDEQMNSALAWFIEADEKGRARVVDDGF